LPLLNFTREKNTNIAFLLLVILLIVPVTYFLDMFGNKATVQAVLIGLPVILIGLVNFKVAIFVFITSLFFDIFPLLLIHIGILLIPYLVLAFMLTSIGFKFQDLKTPFTFVIIIFVLSLLPSLLNSRALTNSMLNMLIWPSFLLLVILLAVSLREMKKINFVTALYVGIVTLNSFYCIYQGITTGRRSFGFAGVMFVDILGISIVITFILFMVAKGEKKIWLGTIFLIQILASIFTKTRNVWINILLVLLLSLIHIIIKSEYLQINKKKIIRYGLISIGSVALVGSLLISYFGAGFFRLENKQELTQESLEVGDVSNSLVTRYFIWTTGYNGFLQNPVTGIGIYSFGYSSQFYNTLPEVLFKKFVAGLTLHHGYFAILVEAGIVGFTGLMFFLVIIFRRSRKIYTEAQGTEYFLPSFIAFWVLIYIYISLFFSDAWYWGRGILIFAFVLGVISALNHLILDVKKEGKPIEQ
jgi:O-antigen ligase